MNFEFIRKRVYGAARRAKKGMKNARYDTSDIAQESILQLVKEMQDGKDITNKMNDAYLNSVGTGTAKRLRRDNLAKRRSMNAETSVDNVAEPKAGGATPVEDLLAKESTIQVVNALSQLSPEQKLILSRRYFDQQTFSAISEEMGLSVDIVRRLYAKAAMLLRKKLRADGHE